MSVLTQYLLSQAPAYLRTGAIAFIITEIYWLCVWLKEFLIRTLSPYPGIYRFFRRRVTDPDAAEYVSDRRLKIYVHSDPRLVSYPSPVLINFHGGMFFYPFHGTDSEFCHRISRSTACVVLDVEYRSPVLHPFPAPVHDAVEVVNWVLSQPTRFDASRISISGFGSGANIAMSTVGNYFPPETFFSLIAFYPLVDMTISARQKQAPVPATVPGREIPFIDRVTHERGRKTYRGRTRASDPRVSPCFAPLVNYPSICLIVTPDNDFLAPEGRTLAARLSADKNRTTINYRVRDVGHGWDKMGRSDPLVVQRKDAAYAVAANVIRGEIRDPPPAKSQSSS